MKRRRLASRLQYGSRKISGQNSLIVWSSISGATMTSNAVKTAMGACVPGSRERGDGAGGDY